MFPGLIAANRAPWGARHRFPTGDVAHVDAGADDVKRRAERLKRADGRRRLQRTAARAAADRRARQPAAGERRRDDTADGRVALDRRAPVHRPQRRCRCRDGGIPGSPRTFKLRGPDVRRGPAAPFTRASNVSNPVAHKRRCCRAAPVPQAPRAARRSRRGWNRPNVHGNGILRGCLAPLDRRS